MALLGLGLVLIGGLVVLACLRGRHSGPREALAWIAIMVYVAGFVLFVASFTISPT